MTDSRVGMKGVSTLVRLVLCLAVAVYLLAPNIVSAHIMSRSGTGMCVCVCRGVYSECSLDQREGKIDDYAHTNTHAHKYK
jgi:cobalamin synthase